MFAYITRNAHYYHVIVKRYHHWNTGNKIQTEEKKSNGRTDEMIGPKQQLSGSLIIIELTKNIVSFFGKFFHLKKRFLEDAFAYI